MTHNNDSLSLSDEEKKFKENQYVILSMLIAGNDLERFADDAKLIANEFINLTEEEKQTTLNELQEFAPRRVSATEVHRKFERMFPATVDWCGWKP